MSFTKKDLENLIEEERENTFAHHLFNCLFGKFGTKGEIKSNSVFLWRQDFWVGSSYSVFKFEFDKNDQFSKVSTRLNPGAKLIQIILSCAFLWIWTTIILNDFSLENWRLPILLPFFFGIVAFMFYQVRKFEEKNQLSRFLSKIGVRIEEKQEKEWSAENISIRFFTYPICILLLIIACFIGIPEKQFFLSIGIILIVGFYWTIDFIMIIKERRDKDF